MLVSAEEPQGEPAQIRKLSIMLQVTESSRDAFWHERKKEGVTVPTPAAEKEGTGSRGQVAPQEDGARAEVDNDSDAGRVSRRATVTQVDEAGMELVVVPVRFPILSLNFVRLESQGKRRLSVESTMILSNIITKLPVCRTRIQPGSLLSTRIQAEPAPSQLEEAWVLHLYILGLKKITAFQELRGCCICLNYFEPIWTCHILH
ncbi:hypothetical protein GOP47_0012145 [Adiantum capillus-veneris]|uniref:Uncharacterized protein n=1 Tax=Adiantum capillus-veneris TaxID=13818 RepID=A0A9D4ZE71_ADICA|nr:hypothetical protein GOP47_0012145 [Adiantum capillus-veneris]